MVVKLLTVDLLIPGCSSLKEKRFVLKSLKARLRQRFKTVRATRSCASSRATTAWR
jgi:uncharacterized protein YlxP (DUF503 family)